MVAKLENSRDYQFVTGAVSGQVLMSVIDTTMSIAMNTSAKSQRGTLSQNNNFSSAPVKKKKTISKNRKTYWKNGQPEWSYWIEDKINADVFGCL